MHPAPPATDTPLTPSYAHMTQGAASKCPFAHLIEMGPQDSKTLEIHAIANHLYTIIQDTKNNTADPLLERYFGSPNLHPSIFVERDRYTEGKTAVNPDMLPQYSVLIGALHNVFRIDIPKKLDIHIDEKSLDADTQQLLKDFRKLLIEYRHAVVETKKVRGGLLPLYSAMPDNTLAEFEQKSHALVEKLKHSALADSDAMLPLTVGGQHMKIPNKDGLGLFLFTLEQSRQHQLDLNKLPRPAMSFLSQTAHTSHGIPLQISRQLSANPLLKARHDAAYSEARDTIDSLLSANGRALQMANLVSNRFVSKDQGVRAHTNTRDVSTACEGLLGIVHMQPYPERLETPLECALVMQNIIKRAGRFHSHALDRIYQQCVEQDAGERRVLNRDDAVASEETLKKFSGMLPNLKNGMLDFLGFRYEARHKDADQLIAQVALVKDYLERERQPSISSNQHHIR